MSQGRGDRLLFIDVMRGYAILMMLLGHTINVVLREELRDPENPFFAIWYYLTGLTAPTFFFAAGFIFAYLLARSETRVDGRVLKGVKRGLWLMVLGWVFHLKPEFFSCLLQGQWMVIAEELGQSHVLHVIGIGLLALVFLWLIMGGRGKPYGIAVFILAHVSFWIGPSVREIDGSGFGLERIWTTFLSQENAYFPLLPWIGYSLQGAAIGVWAWETKWYQRGRWFACFALFGISLMGLSGLIPVEGTPTFYWRGGEVLILMALIGGLCLILEKHGLSSCGPARIIARCGEETLTIFCLHCIVIYGVWFGVGLTTFFSKSLGGWATVGTALVIEVLFISLALNLRKLREKWSVLRLLR